MKKENQKNLWIIAFTVFISILFSSISSASTYKWEDFTEPFKRKFKLDAGENVTIEINLPEFIIKNYKTVPLYIDHSIKYSGSKYPYVRVNKSIWAVYYLKNTKVLNIKTKHLQFGINKFEFCLNRDVSEKYFSGDATINELRFEFAEIESLRAKFSKKNDIESKPAKYVNNKIPDNNQIKKNKKKDDDLQQLKAFNRSFNKSTRKYLQHALRHLGYYHGRVDGVFGRKTRKAIKAYQKNEGQMVTGYLDKEAVKKLTQMGKVASKNAKKKAVAKAKINKKPVKTEKKKNTDNESQTIADNHIQPKRNLTAFNQKDKKPDNEIKIDLKKESEKQEYDKAEVNKQFNDGIIKTTDELEKKYKSLIDSLNQSMNESFYTQMINAIESCNRTGYYVSGAFISHYMYLRLNDLASMSQTESDFHQKTKLAKHFKNTRNQMIMYYNGSAGNKEALIAVLNKCEEYYQNTDTRSLFGKK